MPTRQIGTTGPSDPMTCTSVRRNDLVEDVPVKSLRSTGRPLKRTARTSEDGVEEAVLRAPKKAKPTKNNNLSVQVDGEEDEAKIPVRQGKEPRVPTPTELKNTAVFHRYKKFKLSSENDSNGEDLSPEDTTFGLGDVCVIKSDVENEPEWLARIDYIGAVDQTRVYILITWFYHPEQIPPGVAQPRVKQNEVFLSDHEQVLETSTVESHVSVGFHTDLPDHCEWFYRKRYITKDATHKKLGTKKSFPKNGYIVALTEA